MKRGGGGGDGRREKGSDAQRDTPSSARLRSHQTLVARGEQPQNFLVDLGRRLTNSKSPNRSVVTDDSTDEYFKSPKELK